MQDDLNGFLRQRVDQPSSVDEARQGLVLLYAERRTATVKRTCRQDVTMAKFTFRLAALLRLRESRRDECRAALAEAFRVDDVLGKQLESLDRGTRRFAGVLPAEGLAGGR